MPIVTSVTITCDAAKRHGIKSADRLRSVVKERACRTCSEKVMQRENYGEPHLSGGAHYAGGERFAPHVHVYYGVFQRQLIQDRLDARGRFPVPNALHGSG